MVIAFISVSVSLISPKTVLLGSFQKMIQEIIGGVVVGGAAVAFAPVALGYVGFTAGGVAAGSLAAAWQASIGERGLTYFTLF